MTEETFPIVSKYRIESEVVSTHCGFDFSSFARIGFDCLAPATMVIIEGADFHFAHLCEEHTMPVIDLLKEYGEL